jgi:hypothetical protein
MNSAWPRRVSLINAKGLPTILSPTISATTGDRPAASGFTPASTGFVFNSETRPSTPTESSSRRQPVGRLCYGLVILVPLLSTTHCCVAVTVRYRTALRRTEADFHRSILLPSQAHESRLQAVPANITACRANAELQNPDQLSSRTVSRCTESGRRVSPPSGTDNRRGEFHEPCFKSKPR